MTYRRRWIGVDPGDRWLGLAILTQVDSTTWTADMRVVDLAQRRSRTHVVNEFLQLVDSMFDVVVAENFSARAVGHQRFNQGDTLRLLGALEYGVTNRQCSFFLVPPGDPKQLNGMFFKRWLEMWQGRWLDRSNPHWRHALSAWRALIVHLMASDGGRIILALKNSRVLKTAQFLDFSTEVFWPPNEKDLYTHVIQWET